MVNYLHEKRIWDLIYVFEDIMGILFASMIVEEKEKKKNRRSSGRRR
jgi:hypothetical protein